MLSMFWLKNEHCFFKSKCFNLRRLQLEVKVRKIVAIVLYRFAHELSPKYMSNRFDVGAYTIHKYVNIVCDVFCNQDKLFDEYIKTPTRDLLLHIIQQFEDLISSPDICGVIHGTHIPLLKRLNKRYIIATASYYN
jgi:hypothetical protein